MRMMEREKAATRIGAILIVLLIAALARLWHLGEAPPGLQHDEIFKAAEGRLIAEQGDFRIFYPSNQGHEGGYIWLLGLSYILFDHTLIMVRFPAMLCGMLTVALIYRVAANFYGHRTGMIAAGLAAVSFGTVFTSRVGLRAVSLPPVALAVLWGVWSVCYTHPTRPGHRWRTAFLTGLTLGFAIYTYTSSIAVYATYLLFLLILAVIDRRTLRKRFPELALIGLVGMVLVLPMAHLRLTEDIGLNRVSTITYPWNEFKEGRPGELINNAQRLAGLLAFTGDPEWRYNVADRPLFLLPIGLLAYGGLGILVGEIRRKPVNGLVVFLAIFGLVPSLLTTSAPSFLRSSVTMPSLMIFVAVAVTRLSRFAPEHWTDRASCIIGVSVIVITAIADWNAYFRTWADSAAVQSIYRDDMEQLARYLRKHDESIVLVSTVNAELDAGPFSFENPPPADVIHVIFFSGRTNIVLTDRPALLCVSPLAPITAPHADWLTGANGTQYVGQLLNQGGGVAFDLYRLNALGNGLRERIDHVTQEPVYIGPSADFPSGEIEDWGAPINYPVNFGGLLEIVGVDIPRREIYSTEDGVNIQLYLHPLVDRIPEPLNIFVHLLRLNGRVAAQRDLMGVPPAQWSSDTIFIQDNYVIGGTLRPGRYILTAGLYNWVTGERVYILDETGQPRADRLVLTEIEVIARD